MLLGKKTEGGNYILDKHPNDNHRYILAITFTNKATEEMKGRIVETLDVLASNPDESPYITDLTTMLGALKDDISKSAGIAERQMLEDYTNFNVCTIDTFSRRFCARLPTRSICRATTEWNSTTNMLWSLA